MAIKSQGLGNQQGTILGTRYLFGSVANVVTNIVSGREEMESMLTVDSEMPKELHRPYVDEIKLVCPERVLWRNEKRTICYDCWFDSEVHYFAQWHYPFENEEKFTHPSQLITSRQDQTRGWFYSTGCWYNCLRKPTYKRCLSLAISGQEWKENEQVKGERSGPLGPLQLRG